jgi:hypothetical protein
MAIFLQHGVAEVGLDVVEEGHALGTGAVAALLDGLLDVVWVAEEALHLLRVLPVVRAAQIGFWGVRVPAHLILAGGRLTLNT